MFVAGDNKTDALNSELFIFHSNAEDFANKYMLSNVYKVTFELTEENLSKTQLQFIDAEDPNDVD